jgi:hypothetical protein
MRLRIIQTGEAFRAMQHRNPLGYAFARRSVAAQRSRIALVLVGLGHFARFIEHADDRPA